MTAKWVGLKKLDQQLKTLPGTLQRKYIRQGARRAGSVVILAAKRNLRSRLKSRRKSGQRESTGNLLKSFKQVPSSKWRNAAANRRKGVIGTRIGFTRQGAHAHLLEFGHRMVTRSGKTVGSVRPFPFLRPAIDANHTKVRTEFRKKINEGLRKELAKR